MKMEPTVAELYIKDDAHAAEIIRQLIELVNLASVGAAKMHRLITEEKNPEEAATGAALMALSLPAAVERICKASGGGLVKEPQERTKAYTFYSPKGGSC